MLRNIVVVLLIFTMVIAGCNKRGYDSYERQELGNNNNNSNKTVNNTNNTNNTNSGSKNTNVKVDGNVVEVSGYGVSFEHARNDALRNAVEKVAGVKIFSQSVVKDFVALKDVVTSESFGMVTSFTILNKQNNEGEWEVRVRATVSKTAINQWDKIKVIFAQKGSPSIMFCLKEKLDGVEREDSAGEGELLNTFIKLGFEVIDRKNFEDTKHLHKKITTMEGNFDDMVAVASKRGADLIVVGMLEGNFSRINTSHLGKEYYHNYQFRTKIIRTDTSQVIGSTVENFMHRGSTETYSEQSSGHKGFSDAAKLKYIQPMMEDMLQVWIRDVQQGSDMTLVISNVKFRQRKTVLNVLSDLPDMITFIKVKHYRNKRLELSIKSKLSAADLSDKLINLPELPLEIKNVTKNVLQLKYVPKN